MANGLACIRAVRSDEASSLVSILAHNGISLTLLWLRTLRCSFSWSSLSRLHSRLGLTSLTFTRHLLLTHLILVHGDGGRCNFDVELGQIRDFLQLDASFILNLPDQVVLPLIKESDTCATGSSTCRATRPVDVRLRVLGRVILHDQVDIGDVEAA